MTARVLWALVVAVAFALPPAEVDAFGGFGKSRSTKPSATGSKPAAPAVDANYAKGLGAIDKGDWNLAVFHFYKVIEANPKNADAQNWLGYSYRRLKDLNNAFARYKKALAIDPNHKGAHEYIGEAYLQSGNLAKAEEHLAALTRLCARGCEELEELKEAVAKFKARS